MRGGKFYYNNEEKLLKAKFLSWKRISWVDQSNAAIDSFQKFKGKFKEVL